MKKIIGCSCLALSVLTGGAWAAEVDMNATTLVGIGESRVPSFDEVKEEFRTPAVQYLRADVTKLGSENLSFHFYGWGKWQIDDGRTEGDLTTGYLNYRFPKANGYVKAGRFYEFQTTGIEQIDGLGFGADIGKGTRLTLFGGAPVRVDYDNKGDYIYGGKLAYHYKQYFGLGASTVREKGSNINRLADVEEGPEAGGDRDERFLVAGNAWLTPHKTVDINANATYNITTGNIAEQRYLLVLRPTEKFTVSGEYKDYRLKDYFSFTNLTFSPFHQRGDFRTYGGTVNINISKPVELTGFYKYYDGAENEEGDSDRFGVSLRVKQGKGIASLQYMVVDGKSDEDRSFQQVYLYGLYDVSKTVNVDAYALVDFYNRAIYDTNYAVRLSGSAGYKITKDLKVAGSLAYDHNPHVTDGISGMLWLKYDLKI